MSSPDVLSELLVAQLLEEDMRTFADAREAERLQMTQVLADSSRASGRIPKKFNIKDTMSDGDVALQLMAEEARLSGDAALAQALQHSVDSSVTAGQQEAQRLAAAEKKLMLDAEFARRLQEADESGDIDPDAPNMQSAESVLGQAAIERIFAGDLNDKGKSKVQWNRNGKRSQNLDETDSFWKRVKAEDEDVKCNSIYRSASSPSLIPYGAKSMRIADQPQHVGFVWKLSKQPTLQLQLLSPQTPHPSFRLACTCHALNLTQGDGSGNPSMVVFPLRCPECSLSEWADGIPDDVAARVLSEKNMTTWHHQKLLDSLPRHYCPNPRCSALVQLHDDPDEPQAQCPACSTLMCVPCRVVWHQDLSCEEYQALPLDERSPEDQQALQLMKAQNWRRCPKCAFIVELSVGCNHITCRCRTEFCFKCGSLWDKKGQKCTRNPSCELWDEEMLLEERERRREREAQGRQAFRLPQAPPPYVAHAPVVQFGARAPTFDWMHDPDILSTRHWFTSQMIQDLICKYCDVRLNSLADLQYHLSHTRRHAVFACCGRFFKAEADFDRHVVAEPRRFGLHLHQARRNA
ncbi:unnamed protein product [Somion occarium]|uniref:RBR-type E3 ubiquitin transferase n=1 Tax=Somion occarium TaxID=3059160 RepID=A0ABP1DM83_9APHY